MTAARHLTPVNDDAASAGPVHAVIPIDLVDPDPDNIRRDVGDVAALARSIAASGIQQPLGVAAMPVKGRARQRYRLIWGHRRLAAARKAGLKMVPAMVRHDLDDLAALEAQITENLQRQDLSVIEEARAFQRLVDRGRSQRKITALVGRSQAHVSKRLSLLALPVEDQDAIDTGRLTIAEGLELARLVTAGVGPDGYRRAHRLAGVGHDGNFRRAITDELDELEWAPVRDAARARADAEGITLVEWPRNGWWGAKFRPTADNQALLDQPGLKWGPAGCSELHGHRLEAWSVSDCGTHAAAAIAPAGHIVLVCTNPAAHRNTAAAAGGGDKKQTAAERKAAAIKAAKRAAAKARTRRLRELCDPTSDLLAGTVDQLLIGCPPGSPARLLLEVLVDDSNNRNLRPCAKALGIEPVELPYGQADYAAGAQAWVDQATGDEARFARRTTIALARACFETADAIRNGWRPPPGTTALYRLLDHHTGPIDPDELTELPDTLQADITDQLALARKTTP